MERSLSRIFRIELDDQKVLYTVHGEMSYEPFSR